MASARVVASVLQLAAAVVLARLVSPAEFGRAAVAVVLVPMSVIFLFEGFGSALVQRKEITRRHLEAATLVSLVTGVLLTGLVLALAPVVSPPVFGPRVGSLMQISCIGSSLAGLATVSRAMLWRQLDFRRISLIEVASLIIGSVSSVALAAAGLNAEAIVLGAVMMTASASGMLLVSVRPVLPRWHGPELRELARFGVPASLAGLTQVSFNNIDYAVLAARLSAAQVGLYWRAFQVGVVYQEKVSGVMARLAFPIYSRTSDVEELKALHERATRLLAVIIIPLLAIVAFTAPEFVPWAFGDAWQESVLPTQILCVAGIVTAVLRGSHQLVLAAGRPRALLGFNVGMLVAYGATVWFTAPLGIVRVSVAVATLYVLMLVSFYAFLLRPIAGVAVRRIFFDVGPALAASLALLAVGVPMAELMRSLDAAPLVVMCPASLVGLGMYAATLRMGFPAAWADLHGLVRRVVGPRRLFARRRAVASSSAP